MAESLTLGSPITIKSPDVIRTMILDTASNSIICRMFCESTRIFDINTYKFWHTMSASTCTHTICANETNVICGANQTIKIYDRTTGKLVRKIKHKTSSGNDMVYSVVICNNLDTQDPFILSFCDNDTINMWDLNTGAKLGTLNNPKHYLDSTLLTRTGYGHDLLAIYNHMGQYDIDIIDIAANQCVQTLSGHTNTVFDVKVTNNGRLLISSSLDRTIKIWDTTSWECIRTLTGNKSNVNIISISPNDKLLVNTDGNEIKIWDIESGRFLTSIKDQNIDDCPVVINNNLIIYGTTKKRIKLIPFTISA